MILGRALDEAFAKAQDMNVDIRTAAMVIAVDKVAQALNLRGIYP